jgi:hypothetical protein
MSRRFALPVLVAVAIALEWRAWRVTGLDEAA